MNIIKKYKSMSIQVRAALWYTICNFLQNGLAFLMVPVYLYFLSKAEYGRWVTFQSWKDILIIFASLNLYCGVFTKTLVDIKGSKDRYTSAMQGLGTTTTFVLFLIFIVFRNSVEKLMGYNTLSMLLLFAFFLVYPSLQFWLTRQRVEYKYKTMVLVTILISIFTPALSVSLVVLTDLKAYAIIYGYLISQITVGLFFYIYYFVVGRTFYDKEYWSYALKFNMPLIPHYLSLIVLGQSDRIMIQKFCGDADAGVYGFGYQIASVMTVLVGSINGARVPWTYEKLRDKLYKDLHQVAIYLCILIGSITMLLSLLSPEIVRIFTIFGNKYKDYELAIYIIPVVALGLYFTFVYDLFCSIEFYYGKTKYIMVASCVGAIMNIILNAIFIPMVGLIAAAYTTLFCYIFFMFMHFVFMRKVCKDEDIKEPVYNYKWIFLMSFIVFVATLLSLFTLKIDIVRYLLLVVLLIVGFVKRNDIINLFSSMKENKGKVND